MAEQFTIEDHYDLGTFATIEEAVSAARLATEKEIEECGSVRQWRGIGDYGLVYDSKRQLLWSALDEFVE